jgi:hypothetical protein
MNFDEDLLQKKSKLVELLLQKLKEKKDAAQAIKL